MGRTAHTATNLTEKAVGSDRDLESTATAITANPRVSISTPRLPLSYPAICDIASPNPLRVRGGIQFNWPLFLSNAKASMGKARTKKAATMPSERRHPTRRARTRPRESQCDATTKIAKRCAYIESALTTG
jgi:hypothetical protein